MSDQPSSDNQQGPQEVYTYRGVSIPVIDEASSREDLLRYIRILEARLDLTHVFVARPKDLPAGLDDLGSVLQHDLPAQERSVSARLGLVRKSQTQEERVAMLARGVDRVGCLQISDKFYREQERAFAADIRMEDPDKE